MEPEIIYVPSAFKHGQTREDILNAYRSMLCDGQLEEKGNKHGFFGFNCNGNLIEVFYNPINTGAIKVFHAMKCRESVLTQCRR